MRYSTELMPTIDASPGRIRVNFPEIEDPLFWDLYGTCARYSLLNITGFYNLFQSAHYLVRNKVPGDVVECGCFTGGAVIFLDLCFKALRQTKQLILFDTFEGPPLEHSDMVLGVPHSGHKLPDFEESVRLNIAEAGARAENFTLIRGDVLDTLSGYKPRSLAMLRLDTDFYESTQIEFKVLYPKLVSGGVLIVDDYGLFQGSRRATDEYFKSGKMPLLNRIDIGIWAGVKP
jgi:O-methyltransferase